MKPRLWSTVIDYVFLRRKALDFHEISVLVQNLIMNCEKCTARSRRATLHRQVFATCMCRSHRCQRIHRTIFSPFHHTISNFRCWSMVFWTAKGTEETAKQDLHNIKRNSLSLLSK